MIVEYVFCAFVVIGAFWMLYDCKRRRFYNESIEKTRKEIKREK